MMRRRLVVPALAASLIVSAVASSAHAYCRTNSCDPSRGDDCYSDSNGCLAGGLPLACESSCVTFTVNSAGSPRNGIGPQDFEAAIQTSFDTWMNADCGEGAHPTISVSSLGEVQCDAVEYNGDQSNANIYLFRDDQWNEASKANALALTTVWYNFSNGKIYDADVEVNGTGSEETGDKITNGAPEDGADLLSIVTHESGHFLGLGHSPFKSDATMFTVYDPGHGNLRNLTQDDIDGICAIYPPDRQAASNDCSPRHGFSSSCRKDDSGCAAVPGRPGDHTGWLALAVAMLGVLARRRRRASV